MAEKRGQKEASGQDGQGQPQTQADAREHGGEDGQHVEQGEQAGKNINTVHPDGDC